MPTQTINGTSLFYREQGKGFPVVLVHGFPLDHQIFDAQSGCACENAPCDHAGFARVWKIGNRAGVYDERSGG